MCNFAVKLWSLLLVCWPLYSNVDFFQPGSNVRFNLRQFSSPNVLSGTIANNSVSFTRMKLLTFKMFYSWLTHDIYHWWYTQSVVNVSLMAYIADAQSRAGSAKCRLNAIIFSSRWQHYQWDRQKGASLLSLLIKTVTKNIFFRGTVFSNPLRPFPSYPLLLCFTASKWPLKSWAIWGITISSPSHI